MTYSNFYMIKEGNENNILSREITLEDFLYLTEEDDFIIRKLLLGDPIIKNIKFPNYIIEAAIETIVNNKDINQLYELLIKSSVPLYSLIISPIKKCKEKYNELKKFRTSNQIIIVCNKKNLIKSLELTKKINKKIIIDGRNITLKEYKKILSNYDLDKLDNIDLEINYQEQSNAINIKELYKTAIIVDAITKEIEEHNLSPLEKTIYAYDIVKSRVYKDCLDDKDISRDLDKVVQNNYTVCVGYSNLFIAILENLNINAKPLISTKTKHQRSIAYIQDEKYKIDGVYVFDATGDSRKTHNYINNYNYFGLLPSESEKDSPSENSYIYNISFTELLQTYNEDEKDIVVKIDDLQKKEYILKQSMFFINEKNYSRIEEAIRMYTFANNIERKNIFETYERFSSKYNPKKISAVTFFNALYNARKIEYYNGIIESLEVQDVIGVTRDRFISQMIRYSDIKDENARFIKTLEKDYQILSILNKEVSKKITDIERQNLNIRLLKTLRNYKK